MEVGLAASAAEIAAEQAYLDALLAARTEILEDGQEVRVGDRTWKAADFDALAREIRDARGRVKRMSRRGVRQIVPR